MDADFPNLSDDNHAVTSPSDPQYNCVAWAAGDPTRWWWPRPPFAYWPAGTPPEETLEGFTRAFATLGYSRVQASQPPADVEVIALYCDEEGKPTHMARRLPSGRWTSKLGQDVDIEHESLRALEGTFYGRAVAFLARPWR